VANLTLSIVLVRRYGLVGVAIGTLVPVIVINLAWLMPAACRSVGLAYGRFLYDISRPALVPVVVAVGAGMLFRRLWVADGLSGVMLQALGLGLTYSLTWLATMPRPMRARYLRALGWPGNSLRTSIAGCAVTGGASFTPERHSDASADPRPS
jgi:hypothetical protein